MIDCALSVHRRCVILNKIEEYKKQKDGLDILPDVPRYAAEGWEAITDGDKERLKWAGVFFRKQTPGNFMMRIRMPNGITSATQFRTLAKISEEFGKGFCDITTRQQIQLRWFKIENVPEIWRRLDMVGLVSLQTGMDNIRNVVGCPVAGLTPNELFDASPVVRQFTGIFVGKKEYTNLPRKFNVTITACKENCTHAETQDLALTPASKEIDGKVVSGFNVAVGGKMGSGGYRMASPLNLFVTQSKAAEICSHVVRIFRDHGFRELRTKARLAFLIDDWGVEQFRKELERRAYRPLLTAGKDERTEKHVDHVGVYRQKQAGLNYVGLAVPVGRMTGEQLLEVADLAEKYGSGLIRLTIGQNVIIPNVPDALIGALTAEPLLKELRYDPSEIMRGQTLHGLIRHGAFKAMRQQLRKISQTTSTNGVLPPERNEPARSMIDPKDITEGSAKLVRGRGEEMAVFKSNGQLYGIQNICPHEGGQLCNGWIDGGEVVCPLHGYKFDLKTGACSTDPKLKVKVFKLVSQGDQFTLEG